MIPFPVKSHIGGLYKPASLQALRLGIARMVYVKYMKPNQLEILCSHLLYPALLTVTFARIALTAARVRKHAGTSV